MKHFYSFVNDSQCTTNVGNSLFDYVNFATTVSEMNNISKRHVLIKKTIRAFSAAPRFWIKVTPRIRLPCYVGHYLRVPTSRFTSTQAYNTRVAASAAAAATAAAVSYLSRARLSGGRRKMHRRRPLCNVIDRSLRSRARRRPPPRLCLRVRRPGADNPLIQATDGGQYC